MIFVRSFPARFWQGMGQFLLLVVVLSVAFFAHASDDFLSARPILGRDADGQLEVFRLDANGRLWHRWRKPSNGAWSVWC
ncbi:MAG: hypothetical protein ACREFR_12920, partial [Limisphaerales bacterium]